MQLGTEGHQIVGVEHAFRNDQFLKIAATDEGRAAHIL